MPQAYGDDRIEAGPDGIVLLTTRAWKGWAPRAPATPTSVEHPGTAVRWEDEFYEVLRAEAVNGGIRYALTPWDERNVFRVVSDYSPAAEEQRAAVGRDLAVREVKRKTSILLAPLVGHLPAPVQEELELEVGAPASLLTIASAVPLFFLGGFCAVWLIILSFGGLYSVEDTAGLLPRIPEGVLVFGFYLFVESALRIGVALFQHRPSGSLVGLLVYPIWRLLRAATRRPAAGDPASAGAPAGDLEGADSAATAASIELRDHYRMVEPLLAFLTAAEQMELEERFDFDPIGWGKRTAIAVFVFCFLLGLQSFSRFRSLQGDIADLALAIVCLFFVGEQIARIAKLLRGTAAGSVVGFLVRPLARRLFP